MTLDGDTLLVSEVTCISPSGWKLSCVFAASTRPCISAWRCGLLTHNVHIHFEIFMAPIVILMGGKADLLLRYEDATLNPGPGSPSLQSASWSVCGKRNPACELCGLMTFPLVWVIASLIACWVV